MNIFDLQAKISLDATAFNTGVQQAQTAMGTLGGGISAGAVAMGNIVAGAVTSAASDLVDFGKSAIDTGMNFDAAMSNVKAISGATAEEFDLLRNKAKEMGSTTAFTATEAAEALSFMAMAGWETEDMLSGIEGIMNLAAASGESLASTSDIVTDALTAFGLTAADSAHFADVLAAASSAANTNVSMMGETFKYVAPVAGTLGYSIEDMATAIGTMANSGIKGGQAGTALRSALSRLVNPTKQVSDALADLGLIQYAEDTGTFEYNMEELEDEVEKVNKAQEALNTALSKYGEGSSQAISKAQKLAEAQNNLSAEMNAQKMNALSYNAAIVDSEGQMLSFADTVSMLRDAFSGLDEAQQAQYASTIFGQEAMSGMLAIINSSEDDYNALAAAIESSSDAMDGAGIAYEMAQTQLDNLDGAVTIFKSAMDGLKVAIYDTFADSMQDAVKTATNAVSALTAGFEEGGLRGALSAFGEFASSTFTNFISEIDLSNTRIGKLFNIFSDTDASAINIAAGYLQEFFGAFKNAGGFDSQFVTKTQEFFDSFTSTGAKFIGTVAGFVSDFMDGFKNSGAVAAIGTAAASAKNYFEAFLTVSENVLLGIVEKTERFLGAFDGQEVGEIIGSTAKSTSDLYGALLDVSSLAIKDIGEGFQIFLDAFDEQGLADAITSISKACADLFSKFTDSTSRAIKTISENFEGFGKTIGQIASDSQVDMGAIGNSISHLIDNLAEMSEKFEQFTRPMREFFGKTLATLIQTAVGWFVGGFGNMANAISELLEFYNDFVDVIKSTMEGDIPRAINAAKEAFEDSKKFWSNAWQSIVDSWNGAKEAFSGIGSDLVNGLIDGFTSKWDKFIESVDKTASGLAGFVEGIFGINSPSKVFAGIGKNLILGLEKGWDSEFDLFENSVGTDISALSGTAQIGFDSSAIGKASAAGITSMLTASNATGSTEPLEINLILDGDVAATALFDPLRRVAWQKGTEDAVYA